MSLWLVVVIQRMIHAKPLFASRWPYTSTVVSLMRSSPHRRSVANSVSTCGRLRLACGEPRLILALADDPDDDRHETVVHPAQLGALAAEHAFLQRFEPGLVDKARDRILLDAEIRHPPGMHYVRSCDQQTHFGIHGDDDILGHFEQIVLDRKRIDSRARLPRRIACAREPAIEGNAVIDI